MKVVSVSVENMDDAELDGEYYFEFQFNKCTRVVLRPNEDAARVPCAAGGALSVPLTVYLCCQGKVCGNSTLRIRPITNESKTECHFKKSSGDEVNCKFTVIYRLLPSGDVNVLKYTLLNY